MTGERYPNGRFGTPELPEASDEDSRAASLARAAQRLPKPAPSRAVGSTLNVTPISPIGASLDNDARWQAGEDAEQDLREIHGRADQPETIVQADDEQRAYRKRVSDKLARAHRVNEGLRQHNREIVGIVASLEERIADATVRAYEPPDTLTGVVGAAVEGLVAVVRRRLRR